MSLVLRGKKEKEKEHTQPHTQAKGCGPWFSFKSPTTHTYAIICVKPTSWSWTIPNIRHTMKLAMGNPRRVFIHDTFLGPSDVRIRLLVWTEVGWSWPRRPMRGLRTWRSRAFSLACEVGLQPLKGHYVVPLLPHASLLDHPLFGVLHQNLPNLQLAGRRPTKGEQFPNICFKLPPPPSGLIIKGTKGKQKKRERAHCSGPTQ